MLLTKYCCRGTKICGSCPFSMKGPLELIGALSWRKRIAIVAVTAIFVGLSWDEFGGRAEHVRTHPWPEGTNGMIAATTGGAANLPKAWAFCLPAVPR